MGQEDVREREDERVVRWMRDTKEGHALKRYKVELNAAEMEQRQMQGGGHGVCSRSLYMPRDGWCWTWGERGQWGAPLSFHSPRQKNMGIWLFLKEDACKTTRG